MKVTKVYHFIFEGIYISTIATSTEEARKIINQKLHDLECDEFYNGFVKVPVPSPLFGIEISIGLNPYNFGDAILVDVDVFVTSEDE